MNDVSFRRSGPLATADLQPGEPVLGAPREESQLRHYLGVLRRRKWLIFGSTVAALLVGLFLTLMMTPKYTAQTTIEIQRDNFKITGVEGVEPETTPTDMEFYQTQYGLLKSNSLAQRVAVELRLFDDAAFFEMFGSAEAADWFENGRIRSNAPPRDYRARKAAEILAANIGVAPVRLSRLVSLSFTSPNPEFSARVANAWAQNFIETTLARRFEATSYARRFLEGRLNQLRTRLEGSERALVGYAARENIVNLPSARSTSGSGAGAELSERPIVADNLAALNTELGKATAERIAAQSRLNSAGAVVQEALSNDAISGLRRRRAELAAEYASLMVRFEPEYPAAVALRQQIEQLDQSIAREEGRVRSLLRGSYDASVAREANLSSRVDQLKSDVLDLRRRSIQYNIYQRDVDTNRELYNALLQRYKEIGVAGGIGVNNVSIVDPAGIPERPSSPRLLVNLLLSLLAGTALGFGLAFVREQIDDSVSDPADLEGALSLPLLGAIPKSKETDLVNALGDRKADISEAYLAVQTNLAFSTAHGVPRTITVTSTCPGEGKSTTAFALASSLARGGNKVLLVDGDMRSPSMHHLLHLHNERGLSNFLTGEDNVPSLCQALDANLSVMPAGPLPPSAAELLSNDRLDALMPALRDHFDYVIVDAPPVMGLADAPLLAAHVEGVVFVLESHSTKITPARIAIGRLQSAHAVIIGAVLTKFETKRASYGHGYGYGYGDSREAA